MKPYRLLAATADTNPASAAKGALLLQSITGTNAAAAARWLKIYDLDRAPSEVDTPDLTFHLPAGGSFSLNPTHSMRLGCAIRITTGSADADTGACAAGDIIGLNVVITG